MKKQIILLAMLLLPMVARAFDSKIDGIYYNFDRNEHTATVTYYSSDNNFQKNKNAYSGNVIIPATVINGGTKYSVTSIGSCAFYGCSGLTSVTIPNSVTRIRETAFEGCSGLTTVTIPNAVTIIGHRTFYGCSGLTSVMIGDSVTWIGESAFEGCSGLTSVTIPNSVTGIGENAFSGCSGLTSVTLHCSEIGSWFNGNGNIMEIVIGDEVTRIGDNAFSGCSGLTSVTIPNSVTIIGDQAFWGCSGLQSIKVESGNSVYDSRDNCYAIIKTETNELLYGCNNTVIPNSVTSIGSSAFLNCSGLTSVTIPNSVTSIGENAFSGCSGLTSVTLHCSEIGPWFNRNENIKEIVIGDEVTRIGDDAFIGCRGVKSVPIPNSVTSIGENAFGGCRGLKSVTIPNSVTSIGDNAFDGCIGLTSVTLHCSEIGSWFNGNGKIKEIVIGDEVTRIGDNAFLNCSGLTSVTIPNSVTSIGSGAFQNCSVLTSFSIPSLVKSIGENAFEGCTGLSNITIPSSVTSIESRTFFGCSGLISITIPNSVASIGENAFNGCNSLTSVVMGSGVTSIGANAFKSTYLKKTIWLSNTPPTGYKNAEGVFNYVSNDLYSSMGNMIVYPYLSSMFLVDGIRYVPVSPSERTCDAIDCVYDESINNFDIAATINYRGVSMNVKNIQPYIFYNNKYVEHAICDNDSIIGDYAFSDCENLKDVTIGDKIKSIGKYSFHNCSSLQSVNTLKSHSLQGYLYISKTMNVINDYAFYGCKELKNIIIEDREEELSLGSNGNLPLFSSCPLDSVYIGGNITYNTSDKKGYSPFYRNTTLRTVVITDKETEVSDNEFYGCINLQSFSIGDGVTKFGNWAFSGCSSLKSLSFGTQLKSIGKEAFSDCTAVTNIVSKAVTPPSCGTQALDDINKWECTLYVPQGCISAYQAANQWKEFFFMDEKANDEDINENPDKKCATPTIAFIDGEFVFDCETDDVQYEYEIKCYDAQKGEGSKVAICSKYAVIVYATKPGYKDSDVATLEFTLGAGGEVCDTNKDGVVDVADIATIIDKMAGK